MSIEFDDEAIIVNDIKVKDKYKKKYLELRKEYFPRDEGKFRYKVN